MKSFFSSRVSKFNASLTLCLLGVSTLSLPVMAVPQEATQSDNEPVQLLAQDPRFPKGESSTERVRFDKGESSTNLTRDITANGEVVFLINARKGQTLEYKVTTYNSDVSVAEVFVFDMASNKIVSESGPDELSSFVVEKSGDTSLTVRNKTGKTISISLYLDIQ
jgi:hypothetical protein